MSVLPEIAMRAKTANDFMFGWLVNGMTEDQRQTHIFELKLLGFYTFDHNASFGMPFLSMDGKISKYISSK